MQLKSRKVDDLSGWRSFPAGRIVPIIMSAMLAVGCPSGNGPTPPPKEPQPHAGVKIRLVGRDPAVLKAFASRAQGWAARNGATIESTVGDPLMGDCDIAIVHPAAIGTLAERGQILPVPEELRSTEHPGQWIHMLGNSRLRLGGWAGEPVAVPLAGEASVLVLNTKRLADEALHAKYAAKFGRGLPSTPGTYDDIAEIADCCTELGLAAWPARSEEESRTLVDFFRVAACYDRPALTASDIERKTDPVNTSMALLSFTHVADTGESRLGTPGFAAAAKWMARMEPARSKSDAVTSLANGQATMGVLTLAEVGKLPKTAALTFAPLPGTRMAFDAKGSPLDFSNRPAGNYVPYLHGGWFGVVKKNCAQPASAFDLLADLGSPARSLELLSDPALGFGPFRSEHLQQSREAIWQRYGFDAERQRMLADALRANAAEPVVNPAAGLRGPDAEELTSLLAAALREKKPLEAVWPKPTPEQRSIRRHASGLP